MNQPLTDVVTTSSKTNPENASLIVAAGTSRGKISKYYVHVDGKFLPTDNTPLGVLDVKIHYVLDIEFESNLRQLLKFVCNYFFLIDVTNTTSQMRLINTALFTDTSK